MVRALRPMPFNLEGSGGARVVRRGDEEMLLTFLSSLLAAWLGGFASVRLPLSNRRVRGGMEGLEECIVGVYLVQRCCTNFAICRNKYLVRFSEFPVKFDPHIAHILPQ